MASRHRSRHAKKELKTNKGADAKKERRIFAIIMLMLQTRVLGADAAESGVNGIWH